MLLNIDVNFVHLKSSRIIELSSDTPEYYVLPESADIILYTDKGDLKLGTIEWCIVDADKTRKDEISLYNEMDAIDQETSELYEIMEKKHGLFIPNFLD